MLRFVFLFFFVSFSAFSQYKFEREYKTSLKHIPFKAKEFIKKCNFSKKVKWYLEENESGKSFEAKTYHKKHKYSIEFTDTGELMDIEIKLKFSTLPSDVKQHIKQILANTFKKHKIEKTQIQYSGDLDAIYKTMFTLKTNNTIAITKYELVVTGSKDKAHNKYEFLFNQQGKFIKKTQFSPENTDNIEF